MIALRSLRFGLSIVACVAALACDEPDDPDEEDGVEVQVDDPEDIPVGAAPPPGVPNVPIPPGSTLPGTRPPVVNPGPVPAPPEAVPAEDPSIAVPSPDGPGDVPSTDPSVPPPIPGGPAAGEFMLAEDAVMETEDALTDGDAGVDAGAPP